MPAPNVIPFPHRPRRPRMIRAAAYKRTVRFFIRGGEHDKDAPPAQPPQCPSASAIESARATAAQYRALAVKADKAVMQARLLGFAVKWEKRADFLEARRRGPQEKGELFGS